MNRQRIINALNNEYLKNMGEDVREIRVNAFMARIEEAVDIPDEFKPILDPQHKARSSVIQKLSNAANKLAEVYAELDGDSRAYLLRCMDMKFNGEESKSSWGYFLTSEKLRDDIQDTLNLFAQSANLASSTLPTINKTGLRAHISTSIGNTLFDFGIPYSESEDSFAAQCLEYAFDLANLDGDIKYWIQQGKASEWSSWKSKGKT